MKYFPKSIFKILFLAFLFALPLNIANADSYMLKENDVKRYIQFNNNLNWSEADQKTIQDAWKTYEKHLIANTRFKTNAYGLPEASSNQKKHTQKLLTYLKANNYPAYQIFQKEATRRGYPSAEAMAPITDAIGEAMTVVVMEKNQASNPALSAEALANMPPEMQKMMQSLLPSAPSSNVALVKRYYDQLSAPNSFNQGNK